MQLTARGTRPVKPLAEADTPSDELERQSGQQGDNTSAAASPVPEPPSEPVGGYPVTVFSAQQAKLHGR